MCFDVLLLMYHFSISSWFSQTVCQDGGGDEADDDEQQVFTFSLKVRNGQSQ